MFQFLAVLGKNKDKKFLEAVGMVLSSQEFSIYLWLHNHCLSGICSSLQTLDIRYKYMKSQYTLTKSCSFC